MTTASRWPSPICSPASDPFFIFEVTAHDTQATDADSNPRPGRLADLLAEKVDGKSINDGRFFEVTPGAHKLDVMLVEIPVGDGNQEDCSGQVSYQQFRAGEHYKLVESSLGQEVSARLVDSHGKEVAHTGDFQCMPG